MNYHGHITDGSLWGSLIFLFKYFNYIIVFKKIICQVIITKLTNETKIKEILIVIEMINKIKMKLNIMNFPKSSKC